LAKRGGLKNQLVERKKRAASMENQEMEIKIQKLADDVKTNLSLSRYKYKRGQVVCPTPNGDIRKKEIIGAIKNKGKSIFSLDEYQHLVIEEFIPVYNRIIETLAKIDTSQVVTPANNTEIVFEKVLPAIDVRTNEDLIVNCETFEIEDISYQVWSRLQAKEEKNVKPLLIKKVYEPFKLQRYWEDNLGLNQNLGIVKCLNEYVPPPWRDKILTKEEIETLTCPPLVDEFLKHLFPHQESREYVLTWIHYALLERNDTYLVLNGAKGIGKNTLGKLLKSLVGKENYIEPQVSFLESGFNSFMFNKRLIFCDEIRADSKEKIDRLKKYVNEEQTIEFKGVDADRLYKTYSSWVICNNDLSSMHFKWDERRFSVPELTNAQMIDVYTEAQLTEINDKFENDIELHRQFGNWLIYKGKSDKWNSKQPYRDTPRFWEIVHATLSLWEQFIVEKIIKREAGEYELKELKKEFKLLHGDNASKIPIDIRKFRKLMANFRYKGKDKLGEIEGRGADVKIVPSTTFLPIKSNEEKTDIENLLDI
jgi:hypothetical protein